MYSLIISGIISLSLVTSNGSGYSAAANPTNEKAVRHFKQNFKQAYNERWTSGNVGYRVSFSKESVKHVVDYHPNGRWRNTIRIYSEADLPVDVRRYIKISFADTDILMVTELRFKETLAYFIKLRQNGWTKTVKVIDNYTEVIEEFEEQ